MKATKIIFILMMWAGITSSVAQDGRIEPPRLAVKWSPLYLAHFYPSVQFSLEHRVTRNITLQYDFGGVVDFGATINDDFVDRRGFRAIGEIRYYLPSPAKIPLYIAGEYFHSEIRFNRSNVVGYDCTWGDCLYYEYITHKVEHRNQGVGLKYGIILFPAWNRNRKFFFDVNAGAAFRYIQYDYTSMPVGEDVMLFKDRDDKNFFRPVEKNGWYPRPVMGLRVGYVIR